MLIFQIFQGYYGGGGGGKREREREEGFLFGSKIRLHVFVKSDLDLHFPQIVVKPRFTF